MNREEAKQLLPIIQAFAEGKTVQVLGDLGGWFDCVTLIPIASWDRYRIKPEPKLRPWRAEECPLVFVARSLADANICHVAFRQYGYDEVRFKKSDGTMFHSPLSFGDLMAGWTRISEDGTAHPCGVMETKS